MTSLWMRTLYGCAAMFAASAGALAQSAPLGQAPLYDPAQFPLQRGQVQQFTLTPRGDIDGLILSDGTEVKTPPLLSTQIAYAVRPGDTVAIRGLRAAALPLVQAVSITDEATGRTVVDSGPPGLARGPGAPPPPPLGSAVVPVVPIPGLAEVQGRIRMTLHGPQGDVNGALLDDGTVLRLPPPEAYRFATLLQPGQFVVAEGTGFANAIGKAFEVRQLGPSRDQLSLVAPPGPGRDRPPPPAP